MKKGLRFLNENTGARTCFLLSNRIMLMQMIHSGRVLVDQCARQIASTFYAGLHRPEVERVPATLSTCVSVISD